MDEGQPEIKTGKSKFRSEWVVAAAAMTVSILSLVVYIYQAKIMQEQQQTSVWPYLEWTVTTSTSDGFYVSVINKGVGPAIVKKTRLTLDSMETTSVQFTRDLIGEKIDSLWAFYSRVDERVLAPGEEIRLFHIKDGAHARLVLPVPEDLMRRATYEITFASIYGDCWTSYGLKVVEGGCD